MGIFAPIVLVLASLLLAFRIPASTRGRGQPIVLSGVLAIVAFLLVVPAVYLPLDALLPGVNTLDPVTKILLFAAVFVLGDQLAKGLDDARLVSLISGLIGRIAFAAASVLVIVLFLFANVRVSSPMLAVASGRPIVAAYSAVTMGYFTYLALLLLVGVRRSVGQTIIGTAPAQLAAARIDTRGRLLMIVGFALVPVRLVLTPLTLLDPATFNAVQLIPVATFALVVVGLALIRAARRREAGTATPPSFATMAQRPSGPDSPLNN